MSAEEEILKHFDEKSTFKEFRSKWSKETTTNFYHIVLAVHNAGLDWWHVDIGDQVRFGRKMPGDERAKAVFGSITGRKEIRTIRLLYKVGKIEECRSEPLTDKFVAKLEAAFVANIETIRKWKPQKLISPGYWPDQLIEESEIKSEEDDIYYSEGKASYAIHRKLERNGKAPKDAKAKRLKETGKLECEVCGMDFDAFYGELGEGFIEAHHKIPVSTLNGKETKVSDLVLVCSNCHRMLHRGKTLLSIEDLKKVVRKK